MELSCNDYDPNHPNPNDALSNCLNEQSTPCDVSNCRVWSKNNLGGNKANLLDPSFLRVHRF